MLARLTAVFAAALALAAGALAPAGAAGPPRVVGIVTGEEGGAYAEMAVAIESGLVAASSGLSVIRVPVPAGRDGALQARGADLIVAVGSRAARAALATEHGLPVIATLIPHGAFERLVREHPGPAAGRRITAVFMDQPLRRQLDLVRRALPGRQRIGVVLGPDSEQQGPMLADLAADYGFRLALERIRSGPELMPALQRVLQESDVLLAVPDPLVFSSETVQSVLLTSYRHRTPMVGFSPSYVKAGALLAVSSSPGQLASQVTEILLRMEKGEALPPPQYPRYFSVHANGHVARSLGLRLEPEEALEQWLKRPEARP